MTSLSNAELKHQAWQKFEADYNISKNYAPHEQIIYMAFEAGLAAQLQPNATPELREAIRGCLSNHMTPASNGGLEWAIDNLVSLLQAREQQLLTEFLGEKKTFMDAGYIIEAVPVSVIQNKIGELNG